MKKYYRKKLIWLGTILTALFIALMPLTSAVMGATTADVAVTATGAYVSYTANANSYNFGIVKTSTTTNTSGVWFEFNNDSTVTTNISVQMLANAWTSAGTGWTHNDAAAGANTAAMKANSSNNSNWSTSVFVKYAATYNEIAQTNAADTNLVYDTGLSLLAPTSFTDGQTNNNTVRFNFYSAN